MIIESGIIVALGLIFWFFKCSWKNRMRMLSNPLALDIAIFVLLNILHWGTFSGVMVAATGSLICSGLISVGRWAVGYQSGKTYHPGVWNVAHHLSI